MKQGIIMTKNDISIGMSIIANPNEGHEFIGRVIGFHGELVSVQDQENDVFDCELSELKLVEED